MTFFLTPVPKDSVAVLAVAVLGLAAGCGGGGSSASSPGASDANGRVVT